VSKTVVIECENSHPIFCQLLSKRLQPDADFEVTLIANGDIVRKIDGLLALITYDRPSYAEWDAIVEYIEENF
jgi:hypothetical protein